MVLVRFAWTVEPPPDAVKSYIIEYPLYMKKKREERVNNELHQVFYEVDKALVIDYSKNMLIKNWFIQFFIYICFIFYNNYIAMIMIFNLFFFIYV
jgi:hypothetical protein